MKFRFRKRKRREIKFTTKLILWCLLTLVLTIILLWGLINFSSQISYMYEKQKMINENKKHGKYYNVEEVYPEDGDGFSDENASGVVDGTGTSGLNMMLINNIKTEGYVKEMLTMYKKSAEGQIDSSSKQLGLSAILGIQVNETGTYSGLSGDTPIPKSYIPVVNGEIQWKKSYAGVEAEAMTLSNINSNVISNLLPKNNFSAIGGSKLDYYINGINPSPPGSGAGRDVNVFQVNFNSFGIHGGSTPAANMNGWKTSDGRKSDPMYLPDNLSYMNNEVSQMVSSYNASDVDEELIALMYSIYHNGGPGVLLNHAGMGAYYESGKVKLEGYEADYITSFKELLEDFKKFNEKVKPKLYSAPNSRVYATIGLVTRGWTLTQNAFNFLYNNYSNSLMTQAYNEITGESKSDAEVRSYLQSKIGSLPFDESTCQSVYGLGKSTLDGNQYGSLFIVRDRTSDAYKAGNNKVVQFLNTINVGHVQCALYGGEYIYGSMLKYAGVGVDPTNPDTYTNSIPSTEWKPGGSGQTLKKTLEEHGLPTDIKGLTNNRTKLLDYACTLVGNVYTFGGDGRVYGEDPASDYAFIRQLKAQYSGMSKFDHIMPETTHKGMRSIDCSKFIQVVYKETLGIDLPRNSLAQVTASNTTRISPEERLPGDIGGNSSHVVMYVGSGEGGTITVEAKGWQYGTTIGYNNSTAYTWARVNGVD